MTPASALSSYETKRKAALSYEQLEPEQHPAATAPRSR